MGRGKAKKPRVRVTEGALDKARKKIKNTPKRGRWPKYNEIHRCDLEDYIMCFQYPSKVFLHPKYHNACFAKTVDRGETEVYDPDFDVILPRQTKVMGTIRFYCESWDPNGATPLIDTVCMLRCDRISCPYNKKGFITETLKNKTFEDDVTLELNRRHNKKREID